MRRYQGFTLVELLVALFVFSLLSAFAFRAVGTLSKSGEYVKAEQADLVGLQKLMLLWEQDVRQVNVALLTRDDLELDDADIAHGDDAGKLLIDFTHKVSKGAMQTVRYVMRGDAIFRQLVSGEGDKDAGQIQEMLLLRNIHAAEAVWITKPATTAEQHVPSGVELKFEQDGLGSVHRVISLAMGVSDAPMNLVGLANLDTLKPKESKLGLPGMVVPDKPDTPRPQMPDGM